LIVTITDSQRTLQYKVTHHASNQSPKAAGFLRAVHMFTTDDHVSRWMRDPDFIVIPAHAMLAII